MLDHYNGLAGYLEVVRDYCRTAMERADWHPIVQAIAELARAEKSVPDHATRESLSRYQIALDNQLYRALKELRTAQAWREQCLEG